MRWQNCLAADNIQKPANIPDSLLSAVTQSTDSRLSETRSRCSRDIYVDVCPPVRTEGDGSDASGDGISREVSSSGDPRSPGLLRTH